MSATPVNAEVGGTGFFGKVSSHGDFVTRRVPRAFLDVWDDWLQKGIGAARGTLGPEWMECYMVGPVWRFALGPDVCGDHPWVGLWMPSVDRVGRQFPLTVVRALDRAANLPETVAAASDWWMTIEDLARSTLEDGFDLENFSRALLDAPFPTVPDSPAVRPGEASPLLRCPYRPEAPLAEGIGRLGATLLAISLTGHSLWWSDGAPRVAPRWEIYRGLPSVDRFVGLLDDMSDTPPSA